MCDGILFFGDSIIVPLQLRPEMLKLIHESHFGVEKCKSRALELLYWPRMSYNIESIVSECDICSKFRKEHQREPLIPHDIPNARFYKIGVDIMTFKSVDYLVVVVYFSKFPEILELPGKTAATVIQKLKSVFARFGIPNEIVSDNMPFKVLIFLSLLMSGVLKLQLQVPIFLRAMVK